MEILALICIAIGLIINLVYGIILLIKAFQVSIWWGLGYIFIPFVALIFIIVHWEVAKKPFLMCLLAIPLYIIAIIISPEIATNFQ